MICHCDACNYTFESSVLRTKYEVPTRCPDCGKKTVGKHVPAVRTATEEEIADYWKIQKEIMEEISGQLVTADDESTERYNGQNNINTLRRCV